MVARLSRRMSVFAVVLLAGGVAAWGDEAARHVPWLAEVQRAPEKLPNDAPRLASVLATADGKPISDRRGWELRRAELQRAWLDFLGPMPERKGAPKLEVLEEDRTAGVVRQRVRYEVAPGESVEAYLLAPLTTARKRPAVAVFHSTVDHSIAQPAGLRGTATLHFGLTLAQRGYVTLCPRNFLWPTNDKLDTGVTMRKHAAAHPRSKGMARMLHDAQVAVDILAAREDVDPRRLGAIGHSLGAKEVLYLAAFDERVRATVSSEGGVGVKFSNWHDGWYLGPDVANGKFTRDHHELVALVAPRAFLLVGGDSADGARSWPFIDAALPVYRLYGPSAPLGLLNHGQGHAVPEKVAPRLLEWLETYLR